VAVIGQAENVGVRMTMKAAKSLFLDRAEVVSRLDRVARRRLAIFGGYAMRTARNLIKPKKDMTADQLPDELKALIGASRLAVPVGKNGRPVRGARRKIDQSLKDMVYPWPQTTGDPGRAPQYTTNFTNSGKKFNRFKDLIIFVVEQNLASVVIGPIIFNRDDTPGLLENGGQANRYSPSWYSRADGTIGTSFQKKSVRIKPHPYMSTAFDRTLDAQVPRIFREIF
jgi:hypothetical protein